MSNESRRPLKVREVGLSKKAARFLSERNVLPNHISIASIFFALGSALCLFSLSLYDQSGTWWLLVLAAVFIQLRLLCNLFDGMVAIEGGRSTRSGELFNDIPDRIADPLILISAGYSISVVTWGGEIGWATGLFAVMTAYVRTLSSSIGVPTDFRGPMAKQHRMAFLTLACLLSAVESVVWNSEYSMLVALVVILLGSAVTSIRRAVSAYRYLEA